MSLTFEETKLFLKFKVHLFCLSTLSSFLSNSKYNTSWLYNHHSRVSYDSTATKKDFHFRLFDFNFSQVIRQPYFVDRLIVKLKEKENTLQCVYLNEFNMAIGAFVIQSNEAKNWYDGINKARHIYIKLKQDSQENHQISRHHSINNNNATSDSLSIRKSPLGSSIGLFSTLSSVMVCCLNSKFLSSLEFKQ